MDYMALSTPNKLWFYNNIKLLIFVYYVVEICNMHLPNAYLVKWGRIYYSSV